MIFKFISSVKGGKRELYKSEEERSLRSFNWGGGKGKRKRPVGCTAQPDKRNADAATVSDTMFFGKGENLPPRSPKEKGGKLWARESGPLGTVFPIFVGEKKKQRQGPRKESNRRERILRICCRGKPAGRWTCRAAVASCRGGGGDEHAR